MEQIGIDRPKPKTQIFPKHRAHAYDIHCNKYVQIKTSDSGQEKLNL